MIKGLTGQFQILEIASFDGLPDTLLCYSLKIGHDGAISYKVPEFRTKSPDEHAHEVRPNSVRYCPVDQLRTFNTLAPLIFRFFNSSNAMFAFSSGYS